MPLRSVEPRWGAHAQSFAEKFGLCTALATSIDGYTRTVCMALLSALNTCICLQDTAHAIDALDAAVALGQQHEIISGTSRQHLVNDYVMRLSAAAQRADKTFAALLAASMFSGDACTSCMHEEKSARQSQGLQNQPEGSVLLFGAPGTCMQCLPPKRSCPPKIAAVA